MYIDHITSCLFCEISRAITCDVKFLVTLLASEKLTDTKCTMKFLVTLLAGEKLTGAKCTIVGKEHLASQTLPGSIPGSKL